MKVNIFGIFLVIVVSAVAVNAFGPSSEEVRDIVSAGTFEELQAYRDDSGRKAAPWVQSQEDFEDMATHHAEMKDLGYEPGNCPYAQEGGCPYGGRGQYAKRGMGMRGNLESGGCPYMQ